MWALQVAGRVSDLWYDSVTSRLRLPLRYGFGRGHRFHPPYRVHLVRRHLLPNALVNQALTGDGVFFLERFRHNFYAEAKHKTRASVRVSGNLCLN